MNASTRFLSECCFHICLSIAPPRLFINSREGSHLKIAGRFIRKWHNMFQCFQHTPCQATYVSIDNMRIYVSFRWRNVQRKGKHCGMRNCSINQRNLLHTKLVLINVFVLAFSSGCTTSLHRVQPLSSLLDTVKGWRADGVYIATEVEYLQALTYQQLAHLGNLKKDFSIWIFFYYRSRS